MPAKPGWVHVLAPVLARRAARRTPSAATAAGDAGEPLGDRLVRPGHEPPGPWLTAAQNQLVAQSPRAAVDSVFGEHAARAVDQIEIDAQAGSRAIEVFAALLPVGWG